MCLDFNRYFFIKFEFYDLYLKLNRFDGLLVKIAFRLQYSLQKPLQNRHMFRMSSQSSFTAAFYRLASARFYWRSGTFISRESIRTHTNKGIASDPRLFSRYREEADARIINRVCRNNRRSQVHKLGTWNVCLHIIFFK